MIPGVNPRQLKQAMKQMGMTQEELNATQVVIKTPDKTYTFTNPSVQKIGMQGQISFQLSGEFHEEEANFEVSISDDDVSLVVEQAGVSKDDAMRALEESEGDIAQAILNLSQ